MKTDSSKHNHCEAGPNGRSCPWPARPKEDSNSVGTGTGPLSDDRVQLCRPQAGERSHCKWAWTNSICALFLVIGLTGLQPQPLVIRKLPPVNDPVAVVFEDQDDEEPQKMNEETLSEEPTNPRDALDTPGVVSPFVEVANEGIVPGPFRPVGELASAPDVLPPPTIFRPRPKTNGGPTKFVPSDEDWGGRSLPEYPSLAVRRRYQGKVTVEVEFAADGTLTAAQVRSSSGYPILDDAALKHVQRNLQLRQPPGEVRRHLIEIIWRMPGGL